MKKRLEGDGYLVFVVPKRNMNEEQIRAFCDQVINYSGAPPFIEQTSTALT